MTANGRQRSQALHLSEARIVRGVIVCSVRSARVALSNRLRLVKAAKKVGQRCPESEERGRKIIDLINFIEIL